MSRASLPSAALLSGLVTLLFSAGCGATHVAPPPPVPPPAPVLIALLPDPDTHVTGRIRVFNEFGSVDLSTPDASLHTIANAAPAHPTPLTSHEVTDLFGAALAALPPAPKHFILYFEFQSDALTKASGALVPEILDSVKAFAVPEVVIIGHTDTMGDAKSNLALGLKRANAVRDILVNAGLSPALIDVTSHGKGDLLIKTRDNTPEPRNRRVEITVR